MMKAIIVLFCITTATLSFGQENEKLIELGKAYKNFMFRNDPPKEFIAGLKTDLPESLKPATTFIIETITSDNDILKPQFLTLPEEKTLKFIYIVEHVNYNLHDENPIDNNQLVDSLKSASISRNELVDSYYNLIFGSVGNKNQPFDLSKNDFKLNQYNLANDTEKGIFFLKCMQMCGMYIWGYMNVVKPANTQKAYALIKKYPKFNGLKYYQFTDLNFPDFEMIIDKKKGKESYKGFYINKYYETLLSHLLCLNRENAKEKDIQDLLLGSILKDRIFYKYTKHKEDLEAIFKLQKTE